MFALTLAKCCVGALIVGTSIFVPVFVTSKSTSTVTAMPQRSQSTSTKPGAIQTRETAPTDPRQLSQDAKFDNCVEGSLKQIKVIDTSNGSSFVVSIDQAGNYPPPKWKLDSDYQNQCSRSIDGSSTG